VTLERLHAFHPHQTLYVPADRVTRSTTAEFGAEALRLIGTHAADADAFVDAFGVPAGVVERTRERTLAKLERLPVEDLRVDFEDGYGIRSDDEEDRHAEAAARTIADMRADGTLPQWFGLRVKSFDDDKLAARSVRTLERFVSTLAEAPGGLRDGFLITFPKVTAPEQVQRFVGALGDLESRASSWGGRLRFEVQVETPKAVLGADGAAAAGSLLQAGDGRISAMHLGVFDYTASLGLMPWEQRLDHPANDFAREVLQVALAGTGVRISDGSSNVVPASDRTEDVREAWRVHADHVRHSLSRGFYQGWDLHPSHLASRYAAIYGWLLPHLGDAIERVRSWRDGAATDGVLDEPATISSLLQYLRLVVTSGAVEEAEIVRATGLEREQLLIDRARRW
jgi:citrate lyase beta subunit